MFFEYNRLYINVSAIGWAEPAGDRSLYGLNGEEVLDLAAPEWRGAVESAMLALPAAPGFTFVAFEIDKDGGVKHCGELSNRGLAPRG